MASTIETENENEISVLALDEDTPNLEPAMRPPHGDPYGFVNFGHLLPEPVYKHYDYYGNIHTHHLPPHHHHHSNVDPFHPWDPFDPENPAGPLHPWHHFYHRHHHGGSLYHDAIPGPPNGYPVPCDHDVHIHIDADHHHDHCHHEHHHEPLPPMRPLPSDLHHHEHGLPCPNPDFAPAHPKFLIKDNFLSEFFTESEKAQVRHNLGIDKLLHTCGGHHLHDIISPKDVDNIMFRGRLSIGEGPTDKRNHVPKNQWKRVASIYGMGIINISYVYVNIDIECFTNTIHAETPDMIYIEKDDDHIRVMNNDIYVRDAFSTAFGAIQIVLNVGDLKVVVHPDCAEDRIAYTTEEVVNLLWVINRGDSSSCVKRLVLDNREEELVYTPDTTGTITLTLGELEDVEEIFKP